MSGREGVECGRWVGGEVSRRGGGVWEVSGVGRRGGWGGEVGRREGK